MIDSNINLTQIINVEFDEREVWFNELATRAGESEVIQNYSEEKDVILDDEIKWRFGIKDD